ncbi:MAG: hypothetical protein FWE17_00195 [Alphaproteobacteria bacterium]|nr:hypothetical protein [Alphaproteobacteria bacterium]MCL2757725.1 hypothetical protein [Alphaproteobacteria bacterium]
MKFKLLYLGELRTNPKKRAQHITDIRMKFHPQLKKLVEHSPWTNLRKYMMPNPAKSPVVTKHIGGVDFNPIITPNLKLIAEIDIQLLHPEIVGVARADVDNRVKTLLDALRCPQNEHEIGENQPKNIGPIYTLLDDDHLVTKLSVNTSHFLAPQMFDCEKTAEPANADEERMFLMIDVNVRLSEGTLENLPFMV